MKKNIPVKLFLPVSVVLCSGSFIACMSQGAAMGTSATISVHRDNDTEFLQALLDSPNREIIIPKKEGPWCTEPLFLNAENKLIIFEEGCEIAALPGGFQGRGDCLLTLENCRNISLKGYGASLTMRRTDYDSKPYAKGEWRHGIALDSCENITIEGLRISETGGDGVYIGQKSEMMNKDVTLKNLNLTKNYRQGVSVIAAEGFLMEGCTVTATKGTAPSAGIDFEPNSGTGGFINCVVRDCLFEGNSGPGIIVYPVKLAGSGKRVEIRVENCISKKNFLSVSIYGVPKDITGFIEFVNCDLSFFKWIRSRKNMPVRFTSQDITS